MATARQWILGARPQTLPVSFAAALAGTTVPAYGGGAVWWKAVLAFVVTLAVQVGANFVNDYADGSRGTDTDRVGPKRLVASGAASAEQVKVAAVGSFAVAAVAGVVVALTSNPWLLLLGILCIIVAWTYTGGPKPYSYFGLGEFMVFLFFGPVAVIGTTYVQLGGFTSATLIPTVFASLGVGLLTAAVMASNNLRDIPTDRVQDKRTLPVMIGDRRTRGLYLTLLTLALVCLVALAATTTWWVLLGLAFLVPAFSAARRIIGGAVGMDLVPVLKLTGILELIWALGAFLGALVGYLLG